MPDQAHVTSVEAIDRFRSDLIVYLTAVRPLLEEVSTDVRKLRGWLETDQREAWERQLRLRARRLDEARQELFSAKLSSFREATAEHQMAVHRFQREVEEAEHKLRRLKHWSREFGNRADVLSRPLGALEGVLAQDLARGVAWLMEILRVLEAYAEVHRPESARPAIPNASSLEPTAASPATSSPASPGPQPAKEGE